MKANDRREQIAESLRRLTTTCVQAIQQLEETISILCHELKIQSVRWPDYVLGAGSSAEPTTLRPRPIADRSTLSVVWHGRSCFLGNNLLFRFFEAIARRPNRYWSHQELLDVVWGGPRSDAAIRNVAKRLRDVLAAGGMGDLAEAIDGSEHGYYILRLD
jgi:hypothetical protein